MLTNIKKYKFKPYNKKYVKYYQQEKKKLINFLSKTLHIEHVGSSAVPGLGGKGIIDILIGVPKNFTKTKNKLIKNGYTFVPQKIKEHRLFFRRDYTYNNKTRRVHLHLVRFQSSAWKEPIYFRNTLINNPKLKKEYAEIKKIASKKANGNVKKYKSIKNEFFIKLKKILNEEK